MSDVPPNNKKEQLNKARKRGFFRNLPPFNGSNQLKIFREIESMFRDMALAVDELQSLQVAARETDSTGRPADKARCESFDGQFIRILQYDPSPVYITIEHGLGRVPQGAIPVLSSAATNRAYVEGSGPLNIAPATEDRITFGLFGNIGDEHTFILF